MKTKIIIITLAILALASISGLAAPFGSAFTYQGRLNFSGSPAADGLYDFRFTLHDAATVDSPVGSALPVSAVPVTNGLFTVPLDFGAPAFTSGEARYLQLQVNTNGLTPLVTLNPRQRLTPAPQAIYAGNATTAATASSVAAGAVTSSGLAPGSVGGTAIADGSITSADLNASLLNNTFWKVGGNVGTTHGANFIGTTDNQPFAVKVNGVTALRIDPTATVPNMVGGLAAQRPTVIASGVRGAVVAGGNAPAGPVSGAGAGDFHAVYDSDGVIGGGFGNKAGTDDGNVDNAPFATVGGGVFNTAMSYAATVAGGDSNFADGQRAAVLGGYANQARGAASAVGGGVQNTIQIGADHSSIGGGNNNLIESGAVNSTIGAGSQNIIKTGTFGTVASTIGGGQFNIIQSNDPRYATISGGYQNTNSEVGATVGGGYQNTSSGAEATVAGGLLNTASGGQATVAGGFGNASSGNAATVGGGGNNISSGGNATVSGGGLNKSIGGSTTVSGGANNTSSGAYATIGGGDFNIASGVGATVPGGSFNTAGGRYSFAAGQGAKANHDGAFVWTDSQFAIGGFASTANDQFSIRAQGGVRLSDGTPNISFGTTTRQMLNLWSTNYGIGVQAGTLYHRCDADPTVPLGGFRWYKGGAHSNDLGNAGGGMEMMSLTDIGLYVRGTFVSVSDRNEKENFQPVDPRAVLAKVAALPLSEWNYKQDTSTRHIGPMAQDFYAAFHVGPDDKHITTVDESGVALAAIQGLNQKVEEKDAEIRNLRVRLEKLEQLLSR